MSSKDLSKWLVLSDVDETLTIDWGKIHPKNLEAIKHFAGDLGGHFAIATGRPASFIKRFVPIIPKPLSPWIVLNGAGIYDFEKNEMLRYKPVDSNVKDLVREVSLKFSKYCFAVHFKESASICGGDAPEELLPVISDAGYKGRDTLENIMKEDWSKILFFIPEEEMAEVNDFVLSKKYDNIDTIISSNYCFEIMPKGISKGSAVKDLMEILDIDFEHTAAIGDYYNDVEMLKSVNISAACGQAPKKVKDVAKYHACHYKEGAVADLLKHIESL